MEDVSYTAVPSNKVSRIMVGAGVLCMVFSALALWRNIAVPVIWQVLFLVGTILSVFFLTRYELSKYIYVLTVLEGKHYFLVLHRQGKRESTLCSQPLSQLRLVRYTDREHPLPEEAGTYYRFLPTVHPEHSVLLTFGAQGREASHVRIEPSEEFLHELQQRRKLAAEQQKAEEEQEE